MTTTTSLSPPSKLMAAKLKSGGVASYLLRSVDWRSLKTEPEGEKLNTEEKSKNCIKESNRNDNQTETLEAELEPIKHPEAVEVEAEPDDSVDNQSATAQDKATSRVKNFQVAYQCLPDVDMENEGVEDENFGRLRAVDGRGRGPMQYLDVLLQTDVHGIGINVGMDYFDEGDGEENVLVVQSFRRLNAFDVGPAEACGKIRVGDILHAIDGEGVRSLQQLHAKLAGRLRAPRKFVLLRFLRPLTEPEDLASSTRRIFRRKTRTVKERSVNTSKAGLSKVEVLLRNNPEIAVLVRQLATTNQLLQDQLMASKLKQEEQNIQLDQLHALYTRTQAEGLPLFSLSKSIRPFSRRSNSSSVDDIGTEKPVPSKIQTEVMDAVNTEYGRLRQEFQLELMLDKRELEQKYAEKSKELHEAAAKKMEMLEAGFQQALQHHATTQHCCCNHRTSIASCKSSGMGSQHVDSTGTEYESATIAERDNRGILTGSENENMTRAKLRQVLDVLTKYEAMRNTRTVKLQALRFSRGESIWTENKSEI